MAKLNAAGNNSITCTCVTAPCRN